MLRPLGALVAVSVLLVPASALASKPETHDGFYFRAGMGAGYLSNSVSFDPDPAQGDVSQAGAGVAGMLLLGGTVADGLVLGGGNMGAHFFKPTVTTGNVDSDPEGDFAVNIVGPFVSWYPDPKQGLHGLLMLGFATAADGNDATSGAATGFGLGLGVGYDFWIGEEWSLGVLGRFQYQSLSTSSRALVSGAGTVDVTYDAMVPALLATITYH